MFDNNLVAIHKSKVALMLNKPACIGMCILELSKVLMYQFHYDYKYGNNSELLFTNTDSLIYEDFSSDKEMFDFSNYSTKSKYYDDPNKLVIRKMKDETGGIATEVFVGLKSKCIRFW